MSPNPRDSGSCLNSLTGLKGDFQPFFLLLLCQGALSGFALPSVRGARPLLPPLPGRRRRTFARAIFTRRDHERASDLPQGTLPPAGGTVASVRPRGARRAAERLVPGWFPAGSRRRQPAKRVLEGLLMA